MLKALFVTVILVNEYRKLEPVNDVFIIGSLQLNWVQKPPKELLKDGLLPDVKVIGLDHKIKSLTMQPTSLDY